MNSIVHTYKFGAFHDMGPLLGWRKNEYVSFGLKVIFFDLQLLQ
jgi:hypothetical protein